MEQAQIRTPRPVGRMGDRQALCFDGGHVAVGRYEAKKTVFVQNRGEAQKEEVGTKRD